MIMKRCFFSLEFLPWDISFDLLDKAIDGFLVHAGLLRKKFGQLVRVTEG